MLRESEELRATQAGPRSTSGGTPLLGGVVSQQLRRDDDEFLGLLDVSQLGAPLALLNRSIRYQVLPPLDVSTTA
ncbi:hypothetical protein GCM10022420_078200 [Streptomyces iranensis]